LQVALFFLRKRFFLPRLVCIERRFDCIRNSRPPPRRTYRQETISTPKIIPLSQQPTYQAAISRVVEIGRALSQTEDLLNRRRTSLIELQERVAVPLSYTERALALARGTLATASPAPESALKEIARLEAEAVELKKGMQTANAEAELIATTLSREFGNAAKKRHVAAVKHVLECVEAVCAANKAERDVTLDLERLGYHDHGIDRHAMFTIGEVDDTNGSPAYYFARDAKEYIGRA
jgi:hypothetical protein